MLADRWLRSEPITAAFPPFYDILERKKGSVRNVCQWVSGPDRAFPPARPRRVEEEERERIEDNRVE